MLKKQITGLALGLIATFPIASMAALPHKLQSVQAQQPEPSVGSRNTSPVDELHAPLEPKLQLQRPQPKPDLSSKLHSLHTNQANEDDVAQCVDSQFSSQGAAQLEAIKQQGYKCVERLFGEAPESVRRASFSDHNIISVAKEAQQQAKAYKGEDPELYLTSLFYWLRAAYYFGDNRDALTTANQSETRKALTSLFSNPYFFEPSANGALLADIAAPVMNNALVAEHFVPTLLLALEKYGPEYEKHSDWGSAFATISWDVLYYCSIKETCPGQFYTPEFITQLSAFIHQNLQWMDNAKSDYHLHNLSYQLANIYSIRDKTVLASLEQNLTTALSKIFHDFGPTKDDNGRRAYMSALSGVNLNNQCEKFGLCDKPQEIIDLVLNNRLSCASGTLFMWAQDMNQEQLEWACNSLKTYEENFHNKMQTRHVPVTPDDNEKLRMVVFNNAREWSIYGYPLFNADTNNGGLYLEGDPEKAGDQATFFAYEDVREQPVFDIWNLRHEYIHYLEGRFISKGDFSQVNGAGRTVWFGEGLAEYLSKNSCNNAAIEQAKTAQYPLSTILNNEYGNSQDRIYPWGYLATRFMFEQHNQIFFDMLNKFKQGQYQQYRQQLVDIWIEQKTYDTEFAQWLKQVESSGCSMDETRPSSPPEPVNIDDVQAGDQFGINACQSNDPIENNAYIQAGEAVCLPKVTQGNKWVGAIHVPQGLENVSLKVTLQHGSGDATLLHGFDYWPDTEQFDYRSANSNSDEAIEITPILPGWNYFDIPAVQGYENATLLARYIQHSEFIATPEPLEANQATQVSLAEAEQRHFYLRVPDGLANLKITTRGNGETDLYLNYAALANMSNNLCQSNNIGSNENCQIKDPQPGTYYLMLDNKQQATQLQVETTLELPQVGDARLIDACLTEEATDYTTLTANDSVCIKYGAHEDGRADFYLNIPSGTKKATVSTGYGSGNIKLYYKKGQWADKNTFDKKLIGSGNTKQLILSSPDSDVGHFLRIHGEHQGVSIRLYLE